MAPLAAALRRAGADTRWRLTGQHEGIGALLAGMGESANEPPPLEGSGLTVRLAAALGRLSEAPPSGPVVVQGDTLSTLAGALWAFYSGHPLVHLEAGLRTPRLDRPFPEEAHRRVVTRLTTLHLAPTATARDALLLESVPAPDVKVVGNTVVDALNAAAVGGEPLSPKPWLAAHARVLMTCHRRENASARAGLLLRVAEWTETAVDFAALFLTHPSHPPHEAPAGHERFLVRGPVSYPEMLGLVKASSLVLTDSGGLQEEAPALGVPVAVLREETERVEGLGMGVARLAPPSSLPDGLPALLEWAAAHSRQPSFPYGEPGASARAAAAIRERFG